MPAKSKAQRRLMAIAEHNPSAVSAENRGVLSMKKEKLREFSTTKEKGLPSKVKDRKKPQRKKSSRGMTRGMRY